jgi:iron complex transport system substrate-binding protein
VKKFSLLMCLTAVLLLVSCARPTQTAESGQTEPRIVSTSVAICEIMDALEIDLSGVPETSSQLPARYEGVTRVGLPMTPDMEIIKSLRPTAVLSPNALQYDLKPLYDGAGLPSIFVNLSSVEGMLQSVKDLGKKYGREEQAQKIIAENDAFTADYNASVAGSKKPRVLLLMGVPGSYMAASEKSYIGNLVKLAGGENVYADRTEGFLVISPEDMLTKEPDIILRAAHGMPEEVKASFQKEFSENDIWKHFAAVKSGKVYDLDYTLFNMTANLKYTDSLLYLRDLFYGEAP